MNFGQTEIIRDEGDLRLLKIGCRNGKLSYCVSGNGPTIHYDDYDDDDYDDNHKGGGIVVHDNSDSGGGNSGMGLIIVIDKAFLWSSLLSL
mgnify:CR=1 FL=1